MKEARERSGLRLDDASSEIRRILGANYGPSRETIRRYESDLISEDRADPLIVMTLAEIYGVSVGQLSWTIARQSQAISKLINRHLRRDGFDELKDETEAAETKKPTPRPRRTAMKGNARRQAGGAVRES